MVVGDNFVCGGLVVEACAREYGWQTISVFVEINCDVLVIWNELLMPLWDREDLLWMKWFHGTWNGGEAHGLKGGNGNQLKKTTRLWCR